MSKLKALNGYLIAEPIKVGDQTRAGLYVPENAEKKAYRARVIDISNIVWCDSIGGNINRTQILAKSSDLTNSNWHIYGHIDILVNSIIHYDKYDAKEILFEEKKYIALDTRKVLAIEQSDE